MAGHVPWNAVINLGNSIIGVSILAMPWCFRECGVVLGIALLLCGGFLTKSTCYLLLRASKVTRRHSYEFLAQHTLGAAGKMLVEFSIICLLMCTCIAFFVIIGDLAPSIVARWLGLENSWHLRCCLLVLVAVFIVLPLGMKRNVESLGSLSLMSICFYLLFTLDILWDSLPSLLSLEWMQTMELWRLPGVLKGLSIFSMSLCCQTTLFVVYDSLQEKTVKQMEAVVSKSVNMVSGIYILVGFFGYVCYYKDGIKGDVLLNFHPSLLSEVLRIGFTVSVALSFPLCIFPCRASIYTLFCHTTHSVENPHGGGDFIPPAKFKLITLMIVSATLVVGITIPNVETILGLTGATMGSLIGFIIPAIIYLRTTGVPNKNTAKVILVIGALLFVCSTYDNISTTATKPELDLVPLPQVDNLPDKGPADQDKVPVNDIKADPGGGVIKDPEKVANQAKGDKGEEGQKKEEPDAGEKDGKQDVKKDDIVKSDNRQEPPIPHAPDSKEDAGRGEKQVEENVEKKDAVKEEQVEVKKEEARDLEQRAPGDDKGDIDDVKKDGKKEADVKSVEKENEEKQKELEEKEQQLKDKEDNLDKLVEDKLAEHEQKQEEQEKKLEQLEMRQHQQEKIIEAQAEVIEELKVQHQDAPELGGGLPVGGVLDELMGVQMDQAADQMGGQQQLIGQQPVGQPPIGQQPIGQQPIGQQPIGQQPIGQQPIGQQPIGQQPVGQQPIGQQPIGQQPIGQQPVGQQPIGQQPIGQQPIGQQPIGQQPIGQQPIGQQPIGQQPIGQQPIGQQPIGQQPMGQQQPAMQQQVHLFQQQDGKQLQPGLQPDAAGQPLVQLGGAGQAGLGAPVALDPQGGLPQGGLAPAGGLAPQPVDTGNQLDNKDGHIVRRDAPLNPQQQLVQQQQFAQQGQQLQQQQQQQQILLQQQVPNNLPLQQQQLNMPNQQLNVAGQQPLQPKIPGQEMGQLNMQGAVAQHRQLLQGDPQIPSLLAELDNDVAADLVPDTKAEDEEPNEDEANRQPDQEQVAVNADGNQQGEDQKVAVETPDEKNEENPGEQPQQNRDEQLSREEQVQEKTDGKVSSNENKEEAKVIAKDQVSSMNKEEEKPKEDEANDEDLKKDDQEAEEDTGNRQEAAEERDNGEDKAKGETEEEVNQHEVKYKTRQEMSIKSTESVLGRHPEKDAGTETHSKDLKENHEDQQ